MVDFAAETANLSRLRNLDAKHREPKTLCRRV